MKCSVPGQVVEETAILVEVGDQPELSNHPLVLVVCCYEAEYVLVSVMTTFLFFFYLISKKGTVLYNM